MTRYYNYITKVEILPKQLKTPFLGNKMDTNNMAIVIGPNIVANNTTNVSDYSLILTEMEMTQRLVEMLIINVNDVFEGQ